MEYIFLNSSKVAERTGHRDDALSSRIFPPLHTQSAAGSVETSYNGCVVDGKESRKIRTMTHFCNCGILTLCIAWRSAGPCLLIMDHGWCSQRWVSVRGLKKTKTGVVWDKHMQIPHWVNADLYRSVWAVSNGKCVLFVVVISSTFNKSLQLCCVLPKREQFLQD